MGKLDPRILEIARESQRAGEALEDVALTRGVVAGAYKYGMHAPNRMTAQSAGLLEEIRRTAPVAFTFLENIPADVVEEWLAECEAQGQRAPDVVFRPYFDPSGGISGAVVEGYAQGVVTMLKERYLAVNENSGVPLFPRLWRAYQEKRFIVKLFNETNIGNEGFARGRAGFADGLRCWKQARGVVKAAYPNALIMSIANTPGNDDLYFTGDAQAAPYWYHGPEAAKQNPTQAEINAAIASCPMRDMFTLCDVIGIHVYANLTRTVSGDLQTWYSRRHERARLFLAPYIAAGKKMAISECDMGYDDGDAARARDFVWWLENVIAPDAAVRHVAHWWNADKGEGDLTWDKHNTRRDGALLPVVHEIAAYRARAGNPAPEPPPNPTPPPQPQPGDDIRLPEWCSVTRATVPAGGRYWHLKRAYWQDSDESGGTHHIYALNPHDGACELAANVESTSVTVRARLDKPANEPAGNIAMSGGGNRYRAWVEGRGVALSDSAGGLTMPQNQHVSYFLEWEERTKASAPMPTFDVTTRFIQLATAEFGAAFEDLRAALPKHPTRRFDAIDSRNMQYICFHHTATAINATWQQVAGYHVNNNGWAGIGYHIGIRQGKVALLGDLDTQRAHVLNRNHEALGVAWMGNSETTEVPAADVAMMRRLVKVLDALYDRDKELTWHGQMLPGYTECPGAKLRAIVPTLRSVIAPPSPPAPVLDFAKIVWQGEDAARAEEREGRTDNARWIIKNWVEPAIRERDK